MVSHLQTCQRAFVRALLAIAAVLRVEAGVSRDSQPDALRHASGKVFRKASKSPHPEGLQDLRAAKAAWEEALLHTGSRGRPASKDVNTSYRLQSEAVLLTYQSFQDFDQWRRFLVFIQGRLSTWRVKHWCATLELCKTERLHAHVTLQFHRRQDCTTRPFFFEGIAPNASSHDSLRSAGEIHNKASIEPSSMSSQRRLARQWMKVERSVLLVTTCLRGATQWALPTKCRESGRKPCGNTTSWMM